MKHIALLLVVCAIALLPPSAGAQSLEYRFERLWPGLQQPWYFTEPGRLAVGEDGFIYVLDYRRREVFKLAGDGRVVKNWTVFPIGSPNGAMGGKITTAVHVDNGFLYLSDIDGLITKYTTDGEFVTTWGTEGSDGTGPGEFQYTGFLSGGAQGIATDAAGDVYIVDPANHRIQKFSSDGTYLTEWGSEGTGAGQFELPSDIAFDSEGYAYVAEVSELRVQKFAPPASGLRDEPYTYLTEFLRDAPANRTMEPVRMEFGPSNVLYTTVSGEDVRVFTPPVSGLPQDPHTAQGPLVGPTGADIAILGERLLLGDIFSSTVALHLPEGLELARYSATGAANRFFATSRRQSASPGPIAIGTNGDVYVGDPGNRRIQVFDTDGRHLRNINDIVPLDLVIDATGPNDEVLVRHEFEAPVFPRTITVTRYSSDGVILDSWPTIGTNAPTIRSVDQSGGLAMDSAGNIYVGVGVDPDAFGLNARTVQRYTSDGNLLAQWGATTFSIRGLAIDSQDRLYVSENLFEVQRFVPPVAGVSSTDPHVFDITIQALGNLAKVAVDANDNLYVVTPPDRITQFDPDGNQLSQLVERGRLAGQLDMRALNGVAVGADGSVFVADGGNRRVQKFREVVTAENARAILVAGGGPYPGNALWAATEVNTNFIYRTLVTQGFDRETIQYLSDNIESDLDQNGLFDDVDATATRANLMDALLGSFSSDVEELVLVLVDHGGLNTFRLSATETVTADELAGWLDTWQSNNPGARVTVVYDACQAGSFLDELRAPSEDRVLIASTGADENAYFVSQGALSFSNQFWTGIFNGLSVGSAFGLAAQSQTAAFPRQVAMLDADGDGIVNTAADEAVVAARFIGNGATNSGEVPVIGSVSSPQTIFGTSEATVSAGGVADSDGITRVWAVMRPPGFNPGSPDNPVNELPTFDLSPVGGGNYQATYRQFSAPGTYQLTIYARDTFGNTGVPQTTSVTVDSPLVRKSVIIAGGTSEDPLFDAITTNAQLAFNALTAQGYGPENASCGSAGSCDFSCDNICYLNNVAGTGFDSTPTLANIASALENWATQDTQDLTVYLIAPQDGNGYRLTSNASLSASQLKAHLDVARADIPGTLTIIVEGTDAEPFAAALSDQDDRIVIASSATGEATDLNRQGNATFSNYFWNQVANGATVRAAFEVARSGARFSACPRNARLDDNGNGVFNELADGVRAQNYAIGSGVLLAGDDPVIGNLVSPSVIGTESYSLVVENVTTTGSITEVTALISDADGCQQEIQLASQGDGQWSADVPSLTLDSAPSEISVVAFDDSGVASAPSSLLVIGDRIFFSGFDLEP